MADGLNTALGDIGSESILDGGVDAADLSSNSVTTAKIAAGAVTASKQGFVATGSPSVFGNSIQAGEFVTGAGSDVSVAFPTVFGAAPVVLVTSTDDVGWYRVAGTSAGSAVIESENASKSGAWLALGSGAF